MKISTDRAIPFILLVMYAIMGSCLFATFPLVPLNRDAGLYIPIARGVMEGLTPTVELYTSYTPFAYYLYAAWMGLTGTDTSTLFLLVYLFNLLNAGIFFLILRRFVSSAMLAAALSLSYYFTMMVCQAYLIVLEPFQMTFILLAFLAYTSGLRNLARHSLVGLLLGVSIMFKQYSILVLAGFIVTIAIDSLRERRAGAFRELAAALAVILASSVVPFFLFVLCTKADLAGALYSFGFLGGKAVSYSTAEKLSAVTLAQNLAVKVVHLNWLFIPPALYLGFKAFRRGYVNSPSEVVPIFVLSALPIAIRQYGHYFLLIAPWSFLIAGVLLDRLMQEPAAKGKAGSHLLFAVLLCSLGVIAAAGASPSFHEMSKAGELLVIGTLVAAASLILGAWLFVSRQHRSLPAYVLALLVVLGVESAFLALKLPFGSMEGVKQSQQAEGDRISRVFKRGSQVLVVDYPELYVLCQYTNPLHNYSFIYPRNIEKKLGSMDMGKVGRVIIPRQYAFLATGFFEKSGYRAVHHDEGADLLFLARPDSF